MKKTPVFIINHNRLDLPRRMADFIADAPDVEPIIVDNNSDYQPLLDYYETTLHEIIRLKFNYGSVGVWHPDNIGILDERGLNGGFIVTDPDLRIDHIPGDWLHVLQTGLDRHDFACKSGFSLRIDDLPDTDIGRQARELETSYWLNKLDDRYYNAYIDTTFCLCRTRLHDFPAVRAAPPYDAIHVPWYYESLAAVPPDELYYMQSEKARGSTYWTSRIKDSVGA